MSKIQVPCYRCEQRHTGCHSECEAYAKYCRENAKRRYLIKSQKEEAYSYVERSENGT